LRLRENRLIRLFLSAVKGSDENYDYGNSSLFNYYAGKSSRLMIPGRMQHGWAFESESLHYYKNHFIPTFVWSEVSVEHAKQHNWNNFIAIGAPWLYLRIVMAKSGFELVDMNSRYIDKLWVFGFHADDANNVRSKILIDFLNSARQEQLVFKENVTVILSYLDYQSLSNEELSFYRTSISIISIGQRRNNFLADAHLIQLFHILRFTKKIVIDYPSTFFLYAVDMNCEIIWFKNHSWLSAVETSKTLSDKRLKCILEENLNKGELDAYVQEILGNSDLRDPQELLEIFSWQNRGCNLKRRVVNTCALFGKLLWAIFRPKIN
jgi:hypothetical protein